MQVGRRVRPTVLIAGSALGLIAGADQLREAHFEPATDLQQLVIAERESVVFDLGQRRARNAGPVTHFFQGPAVSLAQSAQQGAQGRRTGHCQSLAC